MTDELILRINCYARDLPYALEQIKLQGDQGVVRHQPLDSNGDVK